MTIKIYEKPLVEHLDIDMESPVMASSGSDSSTLSDFTFGGELNR